MQLAAYATKMGMSKISVAQISCTCIKSHSYTMRERAWFYEVQHLAQPASTHVDL